MERLRLAADEVRHDHQTPAGAQRAEHLPHREIERIGMEQRPHVTRTKGKLIGGGAEQTADVGMAQQRPFRAPGGTRGVDHIRQVVGPGKVEQIVGAKRLPLHMFQT